MSTVCHRAPWLVTGVAGETAPVADGAVVVADGRIVAVGRFVDCRAAADTVVDHDGAVLTPALVNGHAHLELSHLAELGQGAANSGDMPGWIYELLTRREAMAVDADGIMTAAREALAELTASGCGLVGDIGNDPASCGIGEGGRTEVLFFLELLGLSRVGEERALAMLASLADEVVATPHGPYSVTPGLLRAAKERARRLGQRASIHLAESADETRFIADGSGGFPDFFRKRGVWDESFVPPGCSPVTYLDQLGVLDAETVCVHCVQVSDEDIALLARRRAKVCLCPGSNRFLGVGTAPAAKILMAGILPALGTDSLASNPVLNLWREMQLLVEDHPALDPATVFAMATRGGAHALGKEADYGTLAVGKKASCLAVDYNGNGKDLFGFLVSVGNAATLTWL
ncbi:MAG: amidohydrolase family protein [Desulfobulbaceae bacterium]|nr:amidohydrolase family protein [Desulfobulbaceae bacterium]